MIREEDIRTTRVFPVKGRPNETMIIKLDPHIEVSVLRETLKDLLENTDEIGDSIPLISKGEIRDLFTTVLSSEYRCVNCGKVFKTVETKCRRERCPIHYCKECNDLLEIK